MNNPATTTPTATQQTAAAANEYRYNSGVSQDYSLASELADYEAEQEAEGNEELCELCGFPPAGRPDCIRGAHARYPLPEQDAERLEAEGRAEMYATLGLGLY